MKRLLSILLLLAGIQAVAYTQTTGELKGTVTEEDGKTPIREEFEGEFEAHKCVGFKEGWIVNPKEIESLRETLPANILESFGWSKKEVKPKEIKAVKEEIKITEPTKLKGE